LKVKLDENLPERIVAGLAALGHDADTVTGEGFGGATDEDLWPKVQRAARFLVTKDLGFSDERRNPPAPITASWCFDSRTTAAAPRPSD
jgi:predicted nuclease of predicted toxin-antitoxin system